MTVQFSPIHYAKTPAQISVEQTVTKALVQFPLDALVRLELFIKLHPDRLLLSGEYVDEKRIDQPHECKMCPMVAGLPLDVLCNEIFAEKKCCEEVVEKYYGEHTPRFDVNPTHNGYEFCDVLFYFTPEEVLEIVREIKKQKMESDHNEDETTAGSVS